jgi:predicted ATPase
VLTGLWQCSFVGAKFQRASELAEQIFHHFQSVQEPAVLLTAHWALGTTFYFMGELTFARDHLEQAIALYDPQQHHDLTFFFGQDPRLFALLYVSHTLWLLGYPDQALKLSREALTLAKETVHSYNLAITLSLAAVLYYLRRTEQAAQHLAQEAITLSTEHGFAQWIAHGVILRGWALARLGQGEEEIFNMGQAMDAWRATGAMLARPVYSNMLAEAYRIAGQVEEGLSVLAEALAIVRNSGERWTLAETYRLKGELLLLQSADEGQAEHYFHQAIDAARLQSARSWELRAAISLSRLWRKQGKQKEAYQMLVEVYNWFTEGFDTPDLKEARVLLEELL